MRLKNLFVAVSLLAFFAVAAPAQNKDDKDAAALQDLVKQMVEAQTAFDVSALEKLTTADYIEISPLGEFDPRDVCNAQGKRRMESGFGAVYQHSPGRRAAAAPRQN